MALASGFITLPMYNWPEVSDATMALEQALAQSLRAAGCEVAELPSMLGHASLDEHWRSKDLLLGQTCGLPLVTGLQAQVAVVGSVAYAIDASPGDYHSVIITPVDRALPDNGGFADMRYAVNGFKSQSGFAALQTWLLDNGHPPADASRCILTGAHRASIKAVADGTADIAAIDAVSFAFARRHEPATKQVRIVAQTQDIPGLPIITAARNWQCVERLQNCVGDGIANLPGEVRDALLIDHFVPRSADDYSVIHTGWRRIVEAGIVMEEVHDARASGMKK